MKLFKKMIAMALLCTMLVSLVACVWRRAQGKVDGHE